MVFNKSTNKDAQIKRPPSVFQTRQHHASTSATFPLRTTGSSPVWFSSSGSVLHTGLVEPRAALPAVGLALVWAGERLEGRAAVKEKMHTDINTQSSPAWSSTWKHVWSQFYTSACAASHWLPWTSVEGFLESSELKKKEKHNFIFVWCYLQNITASHDPSK